LLGMSPFEMSIQKAGVNESLWTKVTLEIIGFDHDLLKDTFSTCFERKKMLK
jgi:hypothetical protein